jgi:LysR family transcriptional regulator, hydrogen peroxide-inducible genes activator
MEMHQVRYFLAAAEARNFTRAAEMCNVSAPSLLRAIRLLEVEFGGPLFNRERGNTHLSELGRIALPHLQQLIEEARESKKKARQFLSLNSATLKIGIMCTIAADGFIGLIESFRAQNPRVVMQVRDATAVELEKALINGSLEIAIYCLPGGEPHERTHTMPLFKEQMVIAINAGHPLAEKQAIMGQELNGLPYLDRLNCEFTGYAEEVFADRAITGPTVCQSERDDWILAMVSAGMGYAFLSESSVRYPGVVARPLIDPEFFRTVNLVTVRGRPHSPAVGAFVREVMRAKWQGKEALAVHEIRDAPESDLVD